MRSGAVTAGSEVAEVCAGFWRTVTASPARAAAGVASSAATISTTPRRGDIAANSLALGGGAQTRSGAERQSARALPEAELDQQLLERRAEHRLAVDALDAEARPAAGEHELGERLERRA